MFYLVIFIIQTLHVHICMLHVYSLNCCFVAMQPNVMNPPYGGAQQPTMVPLGQALNVTVANPKGYI